MPWLGVAKGYRKKRLRCRVVFSFTFIIFSWFILLHYSEPIGIHTHSSLQEEEQSEEEMFLKQYPLLDLRNFTKKTKYTGRSIDLAGCMDFSCNKDIGKCDTALPTNFDGTEPPCCTHILRDMARTFDGIMSKLGLEYIVGFSTLLGLVRSDKIIPWTADNDFIIFNDGFFNDGKGDNAMVAMLDLWDNSTGLNFVTWPWPPRLCITKDFGDGKLQRWRINSTGLSTINIWQKGYPYGDVYIMKNLTDTFIGGEYRKCKHRYADVFPIERRMVYNRSFALNFPKEPEQLLRRYYGLDWTTPPAQKDAHGGGSPLICKYLYGLEDS